MKLKLAARYRLIRGHFGCTGPRYDIRRPGVSLSQAKILAKHAVVEYTIVLHVTRVGRTLAVRRVLFTKEYSPAWRIYGTSLQRPEKCINQLVRIGASASYHFLSNTLKKEKQKENGKWSLNKDGHYHFKNLLFADFRIMNAATSSSLVALRPNRGLRIV